MTRSRSKKTAFRGMVSSPGLSPLAEYVEKLPAGEDRDYFERELAKPGWKDNKIGRIMYKVL